MATVVGKDSHLLKRCTCVRCTSIIEYTLNEVQKRTYTDYSNTTDIINYINCPACNYEIAVLIY